MTACKLVLRDISGPGQIKVKLAITQKFAIQDTFLPFFLAWSKSHVHLLMMAHHFIYFHERVTIFKTNKLRKYL